MPLQQSNPQSIEELRIMYPDFSEQDLMELSDRLKGEMVPTSNTTVDVPYTMGTEGPIYKSPATWATQKPIPDDALIKNQTSPKPVAKKTAPKPRVPALKTPSGALYDFDHSTAPQPDKEMGDFRLQLDDDGTGLPSQGSSVPALTSPVQDSTQGAVTTPENPIPSDIQNPSNPRRAMYEQIIKDYGLDKYSPEKREELLKRLEGESSGPNWAPAFAAFGAGLQGKDAGHAGLDLLEYQRRGRKSALDQFDQGRKQAFENAAFGENAGDRGDALSIVKRERDPNSEESKIAQSIAAKMGMDPNVAKKITAEQFKAFSPSFAKMYEVAANNASREKIAKDKPGQPAQQWQYEYGIYGKRMQEANNVFDRLEKSGFRRETTKSGFRSLAPNKLQTDDLRAQKQAERNFLTAVLRKESGATIRPEEESEGAKLYFPRAGDDPKTLAQKRQNRMQAQLSFQSASGNAWDQIPTVPTLFSESSALKENETNLTPGHIENGYKYNGGDPGDQKNWEPVK